MRRLMECWLVFGCLLKCMAVSADVSIARTVAYPEPPKKMPVYSTVIDDSISTKAGNRMNGRVAKSEDGDMSLFLAARAGLSPAAVPDADVDRGIGKAFFAYALPKDDTRQKLGPRFATTFQRVRRNNDPEDPETESSIVRVDRYVVLEGREYPVYGDGSTAVAEVIDGQVRSVIIRWNRAVAPTPEDTHRLTDQLIEEALRTRFIAATDRASVIGTPEIVYYDDQMRIFPMYRVPVIVDAAGAGHVHEESIFIPVTRVSPRKRRGLPSDTPQNCQMPTKAPVDVRRISVDRYASSGDEDIWVANARNFLAPLRQPPFLARNFCDLEPRMLEATPGYVDGANVVLIEAHGKPGCIVAGTCEDLRAYGKQDDGLQLLILHACNVIQTTNEDKLHWWQRWWTIFNGLHTVVGYRTTISRSDGAAAHYAVRLSNDEPMIRAWLLEAAAIRSNVANSSLGKPAAITVCNHQDDTPSQLTTLPNPNCLVAYWLEN